MSKFWQKKYISKYTGAEIDAAVAKAEDATKVEANPTLAGTEAALTGLEVGDTKYKVEQPINVVANPTLAGTESALEGLQVGDTKYKASASPVELTLPATNLAAALTQTLMFYNGLSDGDLKYKSISVNKSDNEAGFDDLVAIVTGCQENINTKTFVDFGGTGALVIQVSDVSVNSSGNITVNFMPFPQGTRIIGNLMLYYDTGAGTEGVSILLYGAKYEDVT